MEMTDTDDDDPTDILKNPTKISLRDWGRILVRVFVKMNRYSLPVVSGGIAYFLLLSLFPAVGSIISIYGLFADPAIITDHINRLYGLMPPDVITLLHEKARSITLKSDTSLGWSAGLALAFSIYTTLLGMKAIIKGINITYKLKESRNILQFNIMAIFLTAIFLLFFGMAVSVIIILPVVFNFLNIEVGGALPFIRWPVILVMLLLMLSTIYRFAPSRKSPKWIWLSPGSIFATLIWIAGTVLFSLYVEFYASYDRTYGTLGAVVIMMVWFWLTGFIILLGALLNAETEIQTGHLPRREE